MEKIIHLYIINECGKKCPMCCNKFYNMDKDLQLQQTN